MTTDQYGENPLFSVESLDISRIPTATQTHVPVTFTEFSQTTTDQYGEPVKIFYSHWNQGGIADPTASQTHVSVQIGELDTFVTRLHTHISANEMPCSHLARWVRRQKEKQQRNRTTMNDEKLHAVEREAKVAQFRDVAGADLDEDVCISLLADNSWSVEATLRQFFENPHSQQQRVQSFEEEEESTYGEEEEDHLINTRGSTNNSEEDDSEGSFNEPVGGGGVRARRRISPENDPYDANMNRRLAAAAAVQQQAPSFSLLLRESLFGAQDTTSAASMARKFAAEFDRIVGPNSPVPQFFESSFEDALLAATTEKRMLCIYLHSPSHPASELFCKNIVCSRAVLQALSDVRIWGGSVETCDGYLTSSKLQCSAFPALVLVNCAEGQHDPRIVDRIYWNSSNNEAERIAAQISAARNLRQVAVAPHQQREFAAQQQQEAFELAERRRMVQEQDAALRRAMEDDARREEEKQRAEREEQEQRARAAEAEEQERLALQAKQASVLPEPAPGKQVATLRFNLPAGQKWSRRFLDTDTVGYVRLVLTCYLAEQNIKLNFALFSNFPKRTYDNDDETLVDAGLVPQAALFVQDLDA